MLRPRLEWEDFFERRKDKIRVFGVTLGLGCALLTARLWHLQVIEHSNLAGRAESNRIRQVTLEGRRGLITDRDGVPLVDTRPSFQLSIIPEDTPDPKGALAKLSGKIDLDVKASLASIRAARPFEAVALARDLDRKSVAFVEERRLELPGVSLEIKPIRHYINGEFAAHLLGYMGSITPEALEAAGDEYTMGDFIGQTGLEKEYEDSLRGVKGLKRVEVDAAGRELAALGVEPSGSGTPLPLTLDYDAQKAAEEALAGRGGAAVAIDPSNGDILAFVSRPSFDPNIFTLGISPKKWNALAADPSHPLQNRVTMGQYPPGSTFKIAMALAALEEKIVTEDTLINCPGHFRLGDKTFRCWRKEGHGAVNIRRALVESCDVFFYTMGNRLGIDRIEKYARRLGLGIKTNIRLGMEKPGLIPTEKWKLATMKEPWRAGETISCAIGRLTGQVGSSRRHTASVRPHPQVQSSAMSACRTAFFCVSLSFVKSMPGIALASAALAMRALSLFSMRSTFVFTSSPASTRVSASVLAAFSIPTCFCVRRPSVSRTKVVGSATTARKIFRISGVVITTG